VKTRRHSRWKEEIYDSELEVSATNFMVNNYDEILHQVIVSCKGSDKVCLLSDKPKD
jgi:hypothetical protein